MRILRADPEGIEWIRGILPTLADEEYLGGYHTDVDWWVAREGAEIVALAGGYRLGEVYHLSAAWVRPEHRGRGIQKRLIRSRVRHAKAIGCSVVHTYTHHRNCRSMNSLIACGFRTYLPPWAVYEEPWVSWRKALDEIE